MSLKNLPANENIKNILLTASKADDLTKEFNLSLTERYKKFLISYVDYYEKKKPKRAKILLNGIELFLTALGAALGFFLIYTNLSNETQLILWIAYVLVIVIVGLTIRLIPTDENLFYLEASKIKLLNLTERLATEVALFSLLDKSTAEDDKNVISQISNLVPDINSLEPNIKKRIKDSITSARIITEPRETNIIIQNLDIKPEVADKLNEAIKQIVELCGNIFSGRDFSAKLYFRVEKKLDNENVELLVPFARFAPNSTQERKPFGTTWVKARGNPAKVWECLERGNPVHETEKNKVSFTYYKSMLAICLPGRIGVLSLTSSHEDAFKDKYDDWVSKSLALSSRIIFLRILEITDY